MSPLRFVLGCAAALPAIWGAQAVAVTVAYRHIDNLKAHAAYADRIVLNRKAP